MTQPDRPLALDLATVTGWACGAREERPAYGAIRLAGEGRFPRYAAVLDWLQDAHQVHRFTRIVAEAPMAAGDFRGVDAAVLGIGLAEHVGFWAWDNAVPFATVVVGTARKSVLGRGSFPRGMAKGIVLDWCRGQGFEPADDNAADAIVLWCHATGWHRQPALIAGDAA